jgi:putative SOS response-associated peptidase YedK
VCYSAQIQADYHVYRRIWGAEAVSLEQFVQLYWLPDKSKKARTPKALDQAFARGDSPLERQLQARVAELDAAREAELQQDIFRQARRVADAERQLQTRVTKKAQEDLRIGGSKLALLRERLADLRRTAPRADDARIYPGWYAPVMAMVDGRRTVLPMRYQCRPGGLPAAFDRKFPGTYNARRDSLEGFWKHQFGFSHGVIVAKAFYENVKRHDMENRPLAAGEAAENVILEFRPDDGREMLVACLWSHWRHGDEELLSFAAITDEPPAEVAAAGHDRCIVPIRREHLDAWLNPDPHDLAALYAILDDRERPYYEHRIAA